MLSRATSRRALRLAGLSLAGLLVLAVLAVFATPLIVRGPLFVAAFHRWSPPRGGQMQISGGSAGWNAVAALALGRPFRVTLDDVRLLDPEGTEVFRSPRVTARLRLQRRPMELVVDGLAPGRAQWRFTRMKKLPGIGFLAALAPPRRAPRPPLPTAAPPPPRAAGPGRLARRFELRDVVLEGLDATFDFPAWAVTLRDVKATGWLRLEDGPRGATFGFEARDVDARAGGSLRILQGARAVTLPFTHARLPRIGTPAETPHDLVLDVERAITGSSRLSGTARFAALFGRRTGTPPGMDIRASWDAAADGVRAALASRGIDAAVTGADARVTATMRATFVRGGGTEAELRASGFDVAYRGYRAEDVAVTVRAAGPPLALPQVDLSLRAPGRGTLKAQGSVADGRGRATVRFDDFSTDGVLPAHLAPLLGGTVNGWLRASGDLAPWRLAVEDLDLALARSRSGPFPRRVRLRGSGAAAVGRDQATVLLRGLRVSSDSVRVGAAETDLFGGRVRVAGTVARSAKRGGEIDAAVEATRVDLARVLPGSNVGGTLTFRATATGHPEEVALGARIGGDSVIAVAGGRYRLPARIDARLRGGDQLVLTPVRITRVGGGAIEASGWVVLDRALALAVRVEDHPLSALGPWTRRAKLAGTMGADVRIEGAIARPTVAGALDLRGVSLREVPLGDARIALTPDGRGTKLAGTVFGAGLAATVTPGAGSASARGTLSTGATRLAFEGRAGRQRWEASASGRLDVDLVRPLLRAWGIAGSGTLDTRVSVRGAGDSVTGDSVTIDGKATIVEPLRIARPGWGTALSLTEGELALSGDRIHARRIAVSADGVRLRLDGHAMLGDEPASATLDLTIDGMLDAGLLARAAPRTVTSARGPVRVVARVLGTQADPRVEGIADLGVIALAVRGLRAPLTIHGGRLSLSGGELTAARVAITAAPVIGGRLTIGPGTTPARARLDRLSPLNIGRVDIPVRAENVAIRLRSLVIDDADFDGRYVREAGSDTSLISGQLRLEAGVFEPLRPARSASAPDLATAGPPSPSARQALAPVKLDIHVTSDGRRFVVDAGWLPDVHVKLDHRVRGTLARPAISGDPRGRGLYSRMLLFLFRLFT